MRNRVFRSQESECQGPGRGEPRVRPKRPPTPIARSRGMISERWQATNIHYGCTTLGAVAPGRRRIQGTFGTVPWCCRAQADKVKLAGTVPAKKWYPINTLFRSICNVRYL